MVIISNLMRTQKLTAIAPESFIHVEIGISIMNYVNTNIFQLST